MKKAYALAGAVVAAAIGFSCAAKAESWPTRPIQWIVPFAPGGSTDTVARIVADKLSKRLGQQVVVVNKPGAASEIGYQEAATAAPDGYTMVLTVPSVVTNTFYFKNALNPKRLTPVIYLAEGPYILLASAKFPVKSVEDVVKQIKAHPGNVSCALTGGVGSIGCEMLQALTKTPLLKVSYRGSHPGTFAVMQGQINLVFSFSISAKSAAQSDKLRAIATTAAKRGMPPLPELPAMNEVLPGFEMAGWDGVMVPNGTPHEIVMRLNKEMNDILNMPDVKARLEKGGLRTVGGTPEAFAKRLHNVQSTFGKVLAETGVKPK